MSLQNHMDDRSGASRLRSDLRVLSHLLAHPVRGDSHAQRLESFYSGQADDYDSFRSRLLHGRHELIDTVIFPQSGVWMDLGAGTGENVLHAGTRTQCLREIHLVDLSPSLLGVARSRVADASIENVQFHLADATEFDFPADSVDLMTFSYSLTMIPNWFDAIRFAEHALRPGGTIAVTDFYVSRKFPEPGHRQHGWMRRSFWSHWFASDNVFLSGDHVAMLHRRFNKQTFHERQGRVPYLPLLRAPYYIFIGSLGNG